MWQKRGYCPKCDAERELVVRTVDQTFPVRGEPVTVKCEVAFCRHCGEDVFDRELDFANLERAYAEYRRRHDLPSPREIVALREKYGLGQRALAKLLGWSPATVYRYEKGAVPTVAHGEALKRLADPAEMARLLERRGDMLSPREFARVRERVKDLLNRERETAPRAALEKVLGSYPPGIENGFRRFDFEKLLNMMVFFAAKGEVYKTALMKLLWYADFLHFKRHAVSISGARYAALPFGPALDKWELCLGVAAENGAVAVEPVFEPETAREAVLVRAEGEFDATLFTPEELATLEEVGRRLGRLSAKALADLSHKEDAWALTDRGKIISYEHALRLKWPE
ncbi:MAG: Transcriptional regulator, XRE family [Clostridia bacterium 62_21]|nr:MAG: Transcriptional regulator, XRE family [Clostridia bacterium 62_21]